MPPLGSPSLPAHRTLFSSWTRTALIAHMGTPGHRAIGPGRLRPRDIGAYRARWLQRGTLRRLASMLTPGGVSFLDPMFCAASAGELSRNPASLGLGGGRGTQARLVNRDVVHTWFPAAFQGSVPLLTRGRLCLRQVGGTQGSCSLCRAGADLEAVPGSRPCLLGPSGTRVLPPLGVSSRRCLEGKRLAFGQRELGRVLARCSLGMGLGGLRRWDTGQACSSQNLSSSGSQSSSSKTPVGLCIPLLSAQLLGAAEPPCPSPSHHADRLAIFSAWLLPCPFLTAQVKAFPSGLLLLKKCRFFFLSYVK